MKFKRYYENELEEDKAVEQYIKETPYPSYEEMEKLVMNAKNVEYPIEYWSEYGKSNHMWCKNIYDNLTNLEIIEQNFKKIIDKGGYTAAQKNLCILKYAKHCIQF